MINIKFIIDGIKKNIIKLLVKIVTDIDIKKDIIKLLVKVDTDSDIDIIIKNIIDLIIKINIHI